MKKTMFAALAVMAMTSVLGVSQAQAKKHKVKYSEAKKECLAETPDLAKKELKACIKAKQK